MSKKARIEALHRALSEMSEAFHRQYDRATNLADEAGVLAKKVLALTQENEGLKGHFQCSPGCGDLAWTVAEYGVVLHKHSCKMRNVCQSHPEGCPPDDFEQWAKENRYFKIGPASTTREEVARKWGYIKLINQRKLWWCEERDEEEDEDFCISRMTNVFDDNFDIVKTTHSLCGWRVLGEEE